MCEQQKWAKRPLGKTTLSANVATQGADLSGDIRGGSRAKMAKTKTQDRQSTTRGAAKSAPNAGGPGGPDRSLVEANLTLVEQIVVQVAVNFPRHVDRGELVRAGVLGLVEAANRFDPSKGVPFDKFAARRIRGAILDAVRSADWAPRSVRALARQADSAEQRLASRLGRMPSMEELAREVGATPADLAALRDRVFRSVVLRPRLPPRRGGRRSVARRRALRPHRVGAVGRARGS